MESFHLLNDRDNLFVCPSEINLCPKPRVSPGLDTAVANHRNGVTFCPQLDNVDVMDEEERETVSESTLLLDAVVAMESDGEEESAVLFSSRTCSLSTTDLSDEEMSDDNSLILRRRSSGAALDLCPIVDFSCVSDTEYSSSDEKEDSEEEESNKENTCTIARPFTWDCNDLSLDQIDSIIRSNMTEVEAKKPWRFVFRCLAVPFHFKRQEDPFDVFFLRWDEFWRLHGRALWERAFWQPLLPRSTEYHRRHGRQCRAQREFRELAKDLEDRLGGQYRRWLAKALREGWWYRVEPFSLRKLFLRDRNLYEQYLMLRVKERWPRGRKFLLERGLKPMWWLADDN